MRLLALLLAFSSCPAVAGEFAADAFGLFRTAEANGSRGTWAGYRTSSGSGGPRYHAPGAPDRLLIVVGPKSLVAGKDKGHAVAILLDRHGNLVADGTPVNLRIGEETVGVVTRTGIAEYLFLPRPIAREITCGASAGERQSPRAMVRVVPDIGSIVPELAEMPQDIPYEAFFEIPTGRLTDRFGNSADDGTAVSVRLDHEDGLHSLATTTVSRGRAETRFLSRDIGGASTAVASFGANSSALKNTVVRRPHPIAEPDVIVELLPAIAALRITVGPFLTGDGHALGDGARVLIDAADRNGGHHVAMGWTLDGYVSAMLPIAAPDDIEWLAITSPLGRMDLGRRWTVSTRLEIIE